MIFKNMLMEKATRMMISFPNYMAVRNEKLCLKGMLNLAITVKFMQVRNIRKRASFLSSFLFNFMHPKWS